MDIKEYLEKNHIPIEVYASMAKITVRAAYAHKNRSSLPRKKLGMKLEKMTKGAIRWADIKKAHEKEQLMKKESKGQKKIHKVMHELKEGKLHSGSKKGPIVRDKKQGLAIALSEARKIGAKIPAKKK